MRSFKCIVLVLLISLSFLSVMPQEGRSQPAKLTIVVHNAMEGTAPRFDPSEIILGSPGTILNITFVYDMQDNMGIHTFTIDDVQGNHIINLELKYGEQASAELVVNSTREVTYNGAKYEPAQKLGGIHFYCIPHVTLGMEGAIKFAAAAGGEGENVAQEGIFLRAYWIGLIGIFATIVIIALSYFVIKSGSRHNVDHKEHIRRGLR